MRKPDWIRVKAPVSPGYVATARIVRANGLHTVCEEAGCPNIGECWEKKHATFMIMGDTCTRACAFCNVKTGLPGALDPAEPEHVAEATAKLGLSHVVVTSVDRDDLADGGAAHFAAVIRAIRAPLPADHDRGADAGFSAQGRRGGDRGRGAARRLQPQSRNRAVEISHGAAGRALLRLDPAAAAASRSSIRTMFTKSGIMVGLGEERNEVLQVMDDLRAADVDFLTIGQYLQPTRKHHPVLRFVPPEEFKALASDRLCQGLPDGVGEPADALVASRRRGFRAAEGGAVSGALMHAAIHHHAPGPALRAGHVRPRRRRRALSGIRAALPLARACASAPRKRRQRGHRRRHDGRLQARSARPSPAASRSTGRSWRSWSNISKARSAA